MLNGVRDLTFSIQHLAFPTEGSLLPHLKRHAFTLCLLLIIIRLSFPKRWKPNFISGCLMSSTIIWRVNGTSNNHPRDGKTKRLKTTNHWLPENCRVTRFPTGINLPTFASKKAPHVPAGISPGPFHNPSIDHDEQQARPTGRI